MLERSGLPKDAGPLAVMQTDHDDGRARPLMGDASQMAAGNRRAAMVLPFDKGISVLLRPTS